MKKLIFLLPLFLFLSCENEPKQPAEPVETTFSGTIENASGGELTLVVGKEKIKATVDEAGSFSEKVMLKEPTVATLAYGGERTGMYLEPGNSVTIAFNTAEFDETMTYTGNGAGPNNYLAAKFLFEESLSSDWRSLFGSPTAEFIKQADEIKAKMEAFYNEKTAGNSDLSADFLQMEKQNLLIADANKRLAYPEYFEYLTKEEAPEMPADYYAFLSKIDRNNEQMLQSQDFRQYLESYASYKAKSMVEDNEEEFAIAQAQSDLIATISDNQKIKDFSYYRLMGNLLYEHGANIPENIVATFKENCKNEEYVTETMEEYNKWGAIAVGQEAPGWNYEKINGEMVALKDLQGKVVYVDVWATWCGPCKAELPHLEALIDKYEEGGKIVFTSVSIDENKDAWEKMVTEKEMKGVQVFADKAWKSSICQDYLIKGIPRFMLIDVEGKIIDANAPRPSSEEIKEIFAEIDGSNTLTSMK